MTEQLIRAHHIHMYLSLSLRIIHGNILKNLNIYSFWYEETESSLKIPSYGSGWRQFFVHI